MITNVLSIIFIIIVLMLKAKVVGDLTRDLEYATLIYASGSYLRDLLGYIFLLELRRGINGTVSVSRLGL